MSKIIEISLEKGNKKMILVKIIKKLKENLQFALGTKKFRFDAKKQRLYTSKYSLFNRIKAS